MRPLDPLSSIKMKLGAVICAAVTVTVVVVSLSTGAGVSPVVSALVAGALSLGLVQVLAHGMTSPLREMAAAARAMARGEYGLRVTATSRDEVGELARAFKVMATELGEVDRLRRDLVANVSHELRTPISALQAVLENLVDGVEQADPETLRSMLRQVERLGALVAQLLDLSRLESGAVPLQRRSFDLKPLLEDAASDSRWHRPEVGVAVVVEPPEAVAEGDPERVQQVVANLLDNAIRYSPPGGTVELRGRRARAGVTIEVCDEGPGISEEESTRVFERFYRADAARSSRDGGAGLGLAIARWIVDLHGGEIRAERRQPHGCRMVVTLPAAKS
ncbi:MAG: sensor histidine kinase [Acidimicrobiales bacterium]